MIWDMWKKGFYAWENATANYLEVVLKNPLILGSSGSLLTGTMKARAAQKKALNAIVGAAGLPTKNDQERILHALNQIQSRLIDLEEKLEDKG